MCWYTEFLRAEGRSQSQQLIKMSLSDLQSNANCTFFFLWRGRWGGYTKTFSQCFWAALVAPSCFGEEDLVQHFWVSRCPRFPFFVVFLAQCRISCRRSHYSMSTLTPCGCLCVWHFCDGVRLCRVQCVYHHTFLVSVQCAWAKLNWFL